MPKNDIVVPMPVDSWHGPFPEPLSHQAVDALEAGSVLFFPGLSFEIGPSDLDLLRADILGGSRKNISFDPAIGKLGNTALAGADSARLTQLLGTFAANAERLVTGLLPDYAAELERARTSFRPAEIAGRSYSRRHDDRLLHIDAFPSRPMRGRRILRLFSNVAPDGAERQWRVGEDFAAFARQFAPRIRSSLPGSAWLQDVLGLTKGRRSPYDHVMLGLHDAGKLDGAYQADAPSTAVQFPAGSTWMCFTDQVLHAALAGHCALEQTFHLPVASMAHPERSPLRILESLLHRPLV